MFFYHDAIKAVVDPCREEERCLGAPANTKLSLQASAARRSTSLSPNLLVARFSKDISKV